ncbi:hypothetical protein F443_00405 [Phytophthora nicotianae P1569]|uniref:Uncharacterized protein n=1 Tax=Phytophthora nicotianae P1569 TaxID=1317065 RepID=V9G1R9_PHYNI|nr:hypothetical protein F443_00405 [Phytophthora nicotianae P1569]
MSRLMFKAPTEVVKLSYWGFTVWWFIIPGVHVVTCVYTALYSYSYWVLMDTYLNNYLETFEIGMPPPYHHTIAIAHAVLSVLHAVGILLMLSGSIWQRSLAFTPFSTCDAGVKSDEVKSDRTSSALLQSFTKVYTKISDRHGLFGVNGVHFHVLLIVREVIETGLQTIQAYRMSMLLPRTLLNRFFVILLVTNCWSSVLVYSAFFKGDEASRRFACIVLDCVLDLVSCMGVELIIVLSYAKQYDLQISSILWSMGDFSARTSYSSISATNATSMPNATITGKMSEVEEKWSEFDSSTVVQLLIRHCPALEMPPSIGKFNALHGVKVYNSTIADWGESAAFTSANHPNILSIYLVRVNMADGLLPTGFHSSDFPPNLFDIELCVTNLRAVISTSSGHEKQRFCSSTAS